MYDIIVVGAGTAGLSAAIYGQRSGKKVLLLEAKQYGGQIVNTPEIENYPGIKKVSGFEFATMLYEQAISLGAEIKYEQVVKVHTQSDKKRVVTNLAEYECKSVILATGAKNRPLGVEREQDFIGAGVSYCATCDGMFFRGKEVAVVGGGNTAVEDAIFLSNYCKKVYLIHRREEFRAERHLVEHLREKENVEFLLKHQVISLNGEQRLQSIEVEESETKQRQVIEVAGLFVAIGQMPDNIAFENVAELDKTGYIIAGEDCKTREEGVFTAGDCRTKTVRQLTTAAADGAVAALAACEYIK